MIAQSVKLLIEDLHRRTIELAPPLLYHFTNADAFMGICRHSEIWLGDVRFMNDPTEIAFGEGVALNALEHIGDEPGAAFVRQLVRDSLVGLSDGSIARTPIFAFSMCSSGDALGHWRQYADQGRGYSLGFRSRDLVQLSRASLGLFRVRYNRADQEEVFVSFYREIARSYSEVQNVESYQASISQLARGICLISSIMKDKSYETESEWRVISAISKKRAANINFLAKRSTIKPYIVHKFSDLFASLSDGVVPINNIILGPALEPFVLDAVKMFLSTTQYLTVPVTLSKVPVREVI